MAWIVIKKNKPNKVEIWQSSPSQMWISDIFRLQSLWHTAVSDCQVQSCCYFTTFCLETFGPSSEDLSLHDCAEHVSHRRLRAPASRHTLMLVWRHEKIQIKPGRQFKSRRLLSMVLQWKMEENMTHSNPECYQENYCNGKISLSVSNRLKLSPWCRQC